jgi:membrane-associated phospholipid phosphatase
MRGVLVVCALVLGLGLPREATASEGIDWRWRRAAAWEYAATAAALGGAFALRFAAPSPAGDWRGGILFDDVVHERTAIENVHTRRTAVSVTDAMYLGAMGYRLVDSALLPGLAWGNWDTSLQMSMVDLEAFGVVAILLWGQQAFVGRERPYIHHCPGYTEESCNPDSEERNRSFFAGHPAVVMTAAALTCTHHAHLPLYGDPTADALACAVSLGAAGATGYGRIVTEMHYASDVIVGFGAGAFAGWVVPELLHYAYEDEASDRRGAQSAAGGLEVRAIALPLITDDHLGIAVSGAF